jgi:hypothetical protein
VIAILLGVLDSIMGFLKSKDVRLRDLPDKVLGLMGAER